MRSMTDFIESRDIGDSYSIYNEEYSWAEEYSEYYSEDSNSYLMPVFESSSYQFFGEATFYQEASHKGLIAGGILALVSGAFFMIMKLLNGGSSSRSSSRRSGKGSKKKPPSKKQPPTQKTNQNKTPVQSTPKAAEAEAAAAKGKSDISSDKPKETGADAKGSPKSQTSKKEQKQAESKQTTTSLPELEDQEKIVFNVEIIMKAFEKFKKENGNAGTPYNSSKLILIRKGLEDVSKIVQDMVAITEDDLWYVVSSTNIKDDEVSRFLKNKQKLNETISKLQSESQDLGDKTIDTSPDSIIFILKDIDNLIRSIEEDCKKGMKTCREKRELKEYKEHVSNIDQVYTILNDVLKGINVVCKNIQNEFKTIRKSLSGKQYKSIKMYSDSGSILFTVRYQWDTAMYIEGFKRALKALTEGKAHEMLSMFIKTMIPIDEIQKRLLDSTPPITDTTISRWDSENKPRFENKIKGIREDERYIFDKLKKTFPDYERTVEDVENLATRQLDLVAALVNTPIKDALDKSASEIPAAVKLKEFNDNLEGSISDIVNKMLANKSEAKSSNTSQVDNFIQTIQSTMGVLESAMEIISYEFGKFKAGFEKAVNEYQNDPDQEDLILAVHEAIKKYVYGSDSKLDNEAWNKVESWLENIGYKSINAKPGDSINPIRAYFDRPIPAATSDKSQDMTIKQVQLQPRVLKIKIDGKTQTHKLGGKCMYYVYKA